jgi:hypothetical protein
MILQQTDDSWMIEKVIHNTEAHFKEHYAEISKSGIEILKNY